MNVIRIVSGRYRHIAQQDRRVLVASPGQPEYWDVWEDVLRSAAFSDAAGFVWRLYYDSEQVQIAVKDSADF